MIIDSERIDRKCRSKSSWRIDEHDDDCNKNEGRGKIKKRKKKENAEEKKAHWKKSEGRE